MNLRNRMLAAVGAIIVLHVTVQVVYLIHDANQQVQQSQRDEGALIGRVLERSLTNALLTNDLATVRSAVSLVHSSHKFLRLAVLDERGRSIVDLRDEEGQGTVAPRLFRTLIETRTIPTEHRIEVGNVFYGQILTHLSPDFIVDSMWIRVRDVLIVGTLEIFVLF